MIGVGYALFVVFVVAALIATRQYALRSIDTAASRAAWQQWREAASDQADGPVARRAPKAAEPPTLMLLRDHFAACLAMALILSSVLFGTFAFLIHGTLTGSRYTPQLRDPPGKSGVD